MSDGYVTRNFKREEFACKCGCGKKFYVSAELAKILQALRERVKEPLTVTSGMRCKKHNTEINGAKESYHLLRGGILLGSDITYSREESRTPLKMMRLRILADEFIIKHGGGAKGGLGLYPTWLHIDTRKDKDGARWIDRRWRFPK